MGKGLTVNKKPGKREMTGGQSLSRLSEQIRELKAQVPIITHPDSVPTGEPFISLFPIQQRNLESIVESIRTGGFDPRKALIVGIFPDGRSFLVDGHTRLTGVKELGLSEIPMWYQEFESIESAVDWALHEQIDRRNLSESELYDYVLKVDERTGKGKRADGFKGKSSERTANIAKTSPRKVEQIRTVEKGASEEQKEAIKNGEKSVNQVYTEIREEKKKNAEPPPRNKDWETELGRESIVLIRNGETVPLINFSGMKLLFGVPEQRLLKVVNDYLEKRL